MTRVAAVFFGRPGTGAFNAAGLAGLERAAARHRFVPRVLWEAEPARRAERLAEAAAGADLVIAHGGQGEAGTLAVAPRFPAVAFAVTQGRIAGPNVACFEVLQEHSAFLAGALAAWSTRSGVVAHLSGEPVPPGLCGRAAFVAGAARADPAVRVLTGFCGDQHDPTRAEAWTAAQCAAGADIQFAMLDGGRPGALAALRRAGARAIGNVRDWTAEDGQFLASAVADNGWAVEAAVEAFLSGRFADRRAGIGSGAVRLALAAEVPPEVAVRLDALAAALAAGEETVPEHYAGPEWAPPG